MMPILNKAYITADGGVGPLTYNTDPIPFEGYDSMTFYLTCGFGKRA